MSATTAAPAPRQGNAPEPPRAPCLIVGYDGSETARHAAAWAADALLDDGQLVLVHACRPLHAPASPLESADERHQLGQAILDALLLECDEKLLNVLVGAEVCEEDPVTALTLAAQRHHANAIVLGHHRHSRLHKAIGTVTSELLARSPVPVTVVPATEDA